VQKLVILVVDDDPQITSFLERYLGKQGYEVFCASDWREMQTVLGREKVDLCILDIGLPGKSGLDITREIRENSNMPILVLSGSSETFDQVVGLEFGADDYMVKPYEPRELLARVRTILRRSKPAEQAPDAALTVQFDTWIVSPNERSLQNADDVIEITTTEFEILHAFVRKPHTVFSRNQLLDLARGRESFAGDRAIDVHIMRLRKKLGKDAKGVDYIKTIHGMGYSFIGNVTKSAA